MRRSVIFLALSLVFLFGLSAQVEASASPRWYVDPSGKGEDHGWGGDQGFGDEIPNDPGGEYTSIVPLDFIFSRYIVFRLMEAYEQPFRVIGLRSQNQGGNDQRDPNTQEISSQRGN